VKHESRFSNSTCANKKAHIGVETPQCTRIKEYAIYNKFHAFHSSPFNSQNPHRYANAALLRLKRNDPFKSTPFLLAHEPNMYTEYGKAGLVRSNGWSGHHRLLLIGHIRYNGHAVMISSCGARDIRDRIIVLGICKRRSFWSADEVCLRGCKAGRWYSEARIARHGGEASRSIWWGRLFVKTIPIRERIPESSTFDNSAVIHRDNV
jgi:hypothetical protein